MQVTNISVSFERKKQPVQYEESHPAVAYTAALDDGESHEAAARELMISATRVVYNGLGYDVPERVAKALASGTVPAELSVATETTEAAEAAPEAAEAAPEAAEETPETEEAKPKTRGRPRGSKNTAAKKETAKAKREREAAEADAMQASATAASESMENEVPGDEPTPNISTGGERVNPEDEVPGDDETTAAATDGDEFTPKDLHTLIMSHVNATPRTLSVANAKQVLAHFKVARAQDLNNEQAVEGKVLVEKMIAAAEEQKG